MSPPWNRRLSNAFATVPKTPAVSTTAPSGYLSECSSTAETPHRIRTAKTSPPYNVNLWQLKNWTRLSQHLLDERRLSQSCVNGRKMKCGCVRFGPSGALWKGASLRARVGRSAEFGRLRRSSLQDEKPKARLRAPLQIDFRRSRLRGPRPCRSPEGGAARGTFAA